jgi:hypothetical protein
MIPKAAMFAAVWAAVFVQCLGQTVAGRRAYWQQVAPLVAQYKEALKWND